MQLVGFIYAPSPPASPAPLPEGEARMHLARRFLKPVNLALTPGELAHLRRD